MNAKYLAVVGLTLTVVTGARVASLSAQRPKEPAARTDLKPGGVRI
jgi:hypothetical protein